MNNDDYPYIVALGRNLGSASGWVAAQCQLARRENAPHNAMSRRQDGTWSTTDDMVDPEVRKRYGLPPYSPLDKRVLDEYGAVPHGQDGLGVWDIEFPNVATAVDWAKTHVAGPWAHVCLRSDQGGKFIGDTVVVQLLPAGWRSKPL